MLLPMPIPLRLYLRLPVIVSDRVVNVLPVLTKLSRLTD